MADDLDFDAEEFRAMPASERVRTCRLLAVRARRLAELCGPKHEPIYLRIAQEWDTLANDIEQAG